MSIKNFLLSIGLALCLMGALLSTGTAVLASDLPPIPKILPKGVVVKDIAIGEFNACILLSNGKVQCWGVLPFMALKTGEVYFSPFKHTPSPVHEIESATSIGVGIAHTCAVVGGAVKCWGSNISGQLGNGTKDNFLTPVQVLDITTAKAVAAGGGNTCALLIGGTVKCWGSRTLKDVDPENPDSLVPVTVTEITDAVSIVVGFDDACALLSNNTVKCWRNVIGKRDGALDEKWSKDKRERWSKESKPITVQGLTSIKRLFTLYDGFCAVPKTGRIKCWKGDDAPVMVEEVSFAKAIAGGYRHTCALMPNATVKCWAAEGEVPPTNVSGVASATAIASGISDWTCAIMSKGRTVKCWMIQDIDTPTTVVGGGVTGQ